MTIAFEICINSDKFLTMHAVLDEGIGAIFLSFVTRDLADRLKARVLTG